MSRVLRTARVLAVGAVLVAAGAGRAQVSEASWSALRDREVAVQRRDGTEISGRLIGGDAQRAILETPGGEIVEVPKAAAAGLRIGGARPPDPPPARRVLTMARLVSETPPRMLPRLLDADLRFDELTPPERLELLDGVREDRRLAASAINFFLGYGIGSFIQGDTRTGATLLTTSLLSLALTIGGIVTLADSTWDGDDGRSSAGAALVTVGLIGNVVSHVLGLVLPWSYHGEKHAILKRRLERSSRRASPARFESPAAPDSAPEAAPPPPPAAREDTWQTPADEWSVPP